MKLPAQGARRGFTLVEFMVVIGVMGVIIALAAPSFTRMIEMQRLQGINAQLVTDMQFARSEALTRNQIVGVAFGQSSTETCYTVYATAPFQVVCSCLQGAGNACPATSTVLKEIRTVSVPLSLSVRVQPSPSLIPSFSHFGFDPTTGGLVSIPTDDFPTPLDDFGIDAFLDTQRTLRNVLARSGRATVCRPAQSVMQVAAC